MFLCDGALLARLMTPRLRPCETFRLFAFGKQAGRAHSHDSLKIRKLTLLIVHSATVSQEENLFLLECFVVTGNRI